MTTNDHIPLARIRVLERTGPSVRGLSNLDLKIHHSLSSLNIPAEKLRKRRIAVTVGSRGIANLPEVTRATCEWLRNHGAMPFVFPAMGSDGGATAEGQCEVLKGYGVTRDADGTEICASMETVSLGLTSEGFEVFMDRNAFDADAILVMNRVKPHFASHRPQSRLATRPCTLECDGAVRTGSLTSVPVHQSKAR